MKKIFLIICTILVGVLSVFYMKWKITPIKNNGFNRVFSEDIVQLNRIVSTNTLYGKMLSVNDSGIVLLDGNYKAIAFIDTNANIIKKVFPSEIFKEAKIDHINDVIIEQNKNIILSGNSGYVFFCTDFSQNSFAKKEQLNFNYSHASVINSSTIIFRKTDTSKRNRIFVKYNLDQHKVVDSNYISLKINDGGLSTDGLLLFNNIDKLIYVNYYNSEIIQFDTALNIVNRIATIDNTKKLPTVFYNPQKKTYKFSTPNLIVNNIAAINNKYIVVNSFKRADNENFTRYRDNCVDIYTSNDGLYKSSFHIPAKYGSEIIDMKLSKNNVFMVLTNENLLFLKIK